MNAQTQDIYAAVAADIFDRVTGFHPASITVRGVKRKGYVLTGQRGVLGFIETLGPHQRIEELLTVYTQPGGIGSTARQLMRDLLNAEDYRSDIYDFIVRVYYAEELS